MSWQTDLTSGSRERRTMGKEGTYRRKRNKSITFRLTEAEAIALKTRMAVLGVPYQEYLLKTLMGQPIEVFWGLIDNERLIQELKKLRRSLETATNKDEVDQAIGRCMVLLEQVISIFAAKEAQDG